MSLNLAYASNNANGETASLDMGTGFGWNTSYTTYLFFQGQDLFKMGSGGTATKYQRTGRTGEFKVVGGAQQDAVANPDGSITITNRHEKTTFRFEKIPGNPLRVAAVEPFMLTSITDRNGNVTQLTYQNGLLFQVKDAYQRIIQFNYNANQHVSQIIDPLGRVTQLAYGGYNNLTKIIDPTGKTVQYAYDARHQIISKTDQNGKQWNYAYNSTGHLVVVKDGAGKVVMSQTNPSDWATNSTNLSINKLRTYIPATTTRTDGRGNVWKYSYNADGQLVKTLAPDNTSTTYTYDPATWNLASMTDANDHRTEYTYDANGNLLKERHYVVYPPTDPSQYFDTDYQYEPTYHHISQILYSNGATTQYAYDAQGNRIQEIRDAGGLDITTVWTYYAANVPGNPSPATGLMKTQEVHNGAAVQTTTYEYDAYGNQSKITDPELHVTHYQYDALGNRTCAIDGNGHAQFYQYDALNRLIRETAKIGVQECTEPDADDIIIVEQDYDGLGNRVETRRQANTSSPRSWQTSRYEYDQRNRLAKETRDPLGLNLATQTTYDGNDNRLTVTDPRGKTTQYAYDVQNRLTKITDALGNQTQYAYDPAGNRIQETDANGHKSCSQYDALNRLTVQIRKMGATSCALTAASDLVTQNFYDTGTSVACDHDPGSPSCGGPTPGSGNIAHTIDPEGHYTYFKYDKVDRRWITIRKVADAADACDPAGSPTQQDWCQYTKYDAANNVTARIDANGNRTNYAYYANNWPHTETVDPGGLSLTTTTAYDGAGNIQQVVNPRGNVVVNTYDERNQLLMVVDSVGKVAEYQYDGIGNRIVERDGNQGDTDPLTNDAAPETRYAYDAVNRLVKVTDALNHDTDHGYDKNGNLIKVTDRLGHVTCHTYDNINRRIRTAQLMGGSNCAVLPSTALWTDTEYDAVGNVTRLITARHNSTPAACAGASPPSDCETTAYQYDPANRLALETYADGTTRQFQYDKAGNLHQRTDQLGQVTRFGYSDLYYLLLRDYLDPLEPDDSFQYDIGGRMIRAERAAWVVYDNYDAANRLLQTTQDANGSPMVVQYAYNTALGTRAVRYPGGRICNEQRDLRERLDTGACDSFNVDYAYDLGNRVQTRTYSNNVTATYGYDADNRITSLAHANGGEIADFHYGYDAEGNKLYEEKSPAALAGLSESYAYDPLNRLIEYKVGPLVGSTVPVPITQYGYDLDKVGNWDQFTQDNDGAGPGAPIVYQNTPNPMNEYDDLSTNGVGEIPDDDGIPDDFKDNTATPAPDGENWKHDKNGNRREDGKRIYAYDDENRLVSVTRKADLVQTSYRYDALSRRVVKSVGGGTTTRYAYDDARIVEEQSPAALTLATYVYGNYIDEVLNMQRSGADYYYHQNALWSVAAVTNASAVVVERYDYTDYGCPSVIHSAIGNPWMFTGRQWDEESGLYFYRARYYDCEGGRFLQRDYLRYIGSNNSYLFTKLNPLQWVDPTGLFYQSSKWPESGVTHPRSYAGGGYFDDSTLWYYGYYRFSSLPGDVADPKSDVTIGSSGSYKMHIDYFGDVDYKGNVDSGPLWKITYTCKDRVKTCTGELLEIRHLYETEKQEGLGISGTYTLEPVKTVVGLNEDCQWRARANIEFSYTGSSTNGWSLTGKVGGTVGGSGKPGGNIELGGSVSGSVTAGWKSSISLKTWTSEIVDFSGVQKHTP